MSITTSQQITRFYDVFKEIEVTFTREVIRATNLNPKHVYLKCLGDQWSCIIYSSSMTGARIIANTNPEGGLIEKTRKANNLVSLRFSFKINDKNDPLTFFVAARITGFNAYDKDHPDLQFITLQFTQRPPDDLIEILGKLLEANVNSKKRQEERIIITRDSMRKIGIRNKDTVLFIEGIPRKCLIRDISFSGAKLLAMGIAKFLVNKEAVLRFELEDPPAILDIKGTIIRFETVEGRKDIGAVAFKFNENSVPMNYKMRINEYLSQVRKTNTGTE